MWNLYENTNFLKPLCFSNGKTQEDVVREVIELINKGEKIIFINGICGTGKSAIALNIARKMGKTSIVVPGKNLQNQYKKDYEDKKYLLKNGSKLKISIITGRNNHKCKFLEDNQSSIPSFKREINSKLHDIFAGKKEEIENLIAKDLSADNPNIPCKIEVKEKNWNKIKNYLQQNPYVNVRDFLDIKDVKRVPVASVCPYWSPVLPDRYDLKKFGETNKKSYLGIGGEKFVFHERKVGCAFYEQFNSYINSDVLVFNSLKYKLESALGRKPLTEVEIIDECDEFLDSFANQSNLNIDRIQHSLSQIFNIENEFEKTKNELLQFVMQIKKDPRVQNAVISNDIIPLKETGIYDLLKLILDARNFLEEIDEESYLFSLEETARMFDEFFDETYVTFSKKENNIIASLVTTNLAKKFQEMINKNKVIVLMSGTLHSEAVLKNIFGLEKFKILDAEIEKQGRIEICKTGLEMDCKYSNFSRGNHTREDYLKALDKCVNLSKKPTLVHINAYLDMPSKEEIEKFNLKSLVSREEIREKQSNDGEGILVSEFKKGEIDVLFSTRASRGIDFPGEQCNSIIFTKYPNPNVQDAFWKILNKTNPQNYWDFYKDKARRELWQKVYRGLRFKEDHVFVLSPDIRVLHAFENIS